MKPKEHARLILASASPRRRELLEKAGVEFEVYAPAVNETVAADEGPAEAVMRLAREKASAASRRFPERYCLAADTLVAVPNGHDDPGIDSAEYKILGKPADAGDAERMLELLSGKDHFVFTGFSIAPPHGHPRARVVRTRVRMGTLAAAEVRAYVASGEPLDKAGAYALQGIGAALIAAIDGSYTAVVGLPLREVIEELKAHELWDEGGLMRAGGK